MLIDGLTNAGAMPSLELTMRFAAQRQRLIAHNVANIDTPDFQHRDVSTERFQETLADAVDRRRAKTGGRFGELDWQPTRELSKGSRGELWIEPRGSGGGVLSHDRNDRDLERTLQDLAETAGAFRAASALYTAQRGVLQNAIAERV